MKHCCKKFEFSMVKQIAEIDLAGTTPNYYCEKIAEQNQIKLFVYGDVLNGNLC